MVTWYLLLLLFVILLIGWLFILFDLIDGLKFLRFWGGLGLFGFGMYLESKIPRVIVVEDGRVHNEEMLFSWSYTTDDGVKHDVSGYNVYNKSSKPISIFSVDYGSAQSTDEITIVKPNEFVKTEEIDYYFEDAPDKISVNSKQTGETRWVLEYLSDTQERLHQSEESE